MNAANPKEIPPKAPPLDESTEFVEGSETPARIKSKALVPYLELAGQIFDGTRRLHNLGEDSRVILEQVYHLNDHPMFSGRKKSYEAVLGLVQVAAPSSMDDQAKSYLAATIALGAGKLKPKDLAGAGFSLAQQRQVLTLAAVVQIAASLGESLGAGFQIQQVEATEEVVWIVVSGGSTAGLAAAQRQAKLWVRIGLPEIEMLTPDEAQQRMAPYPEPTEKIGVRAVDPLSEAGRKVMRFHFAQMLRHEEGTRLGEDIEALHDMRVATRRLRSAFEVFADAFDQKALRSHLKGLRAAGRALGAVRDLDVFMEKAQKYITALPEDRRGGLDPLLEHWVQDRENARRRMLDYLDSPAYARFKREFNAFLNAPFAGARQPEPGQVEPGLVRELAPVLIYQRMAAVRAYEAHLDDAPIERLHMLRIEFKKLRYTVEYFREALGKYGYELIENLKLLQDHLGDLNDAQVATQILGEFISAWELRQQDLPIHERRNIEEVVNYMAARHAERHQLLISFAEAWQEHFNNRIFRRRMAQAVAVL